MKMRTLFLSLLLCTMAVPVRAEGFFEQVKEHPIIAAGVGLTVLVSSWALYTCYRAYSSKPKRRKGKKEGNGKKIKKINPRTKKLQEALARKKVKKEKQEEQIEQVNWQEVLFEGAQEADYLKSDFTKIKDALRNKISINVKNAQGNTALHIAAERGHYQLCRFLLKCTVANVNSQNLAGLTPLHMAIKSSLGPCNDIIRLFLKAGANVKLTTMLGETALHYAVKFSKPDAIRLIIMEAKLGSKAPKTIKEALNSDKTLMTIDEVVNDLKLITDPQKRAQETHRAAFRFVLYRIQLLAPLRNIQNVGGYTAEQVAMQQEKAWVSQLLSKMEVAGKGWVYHELLRLAKEAE